MTMNLYKLFSCNVQIQYKSCFMSKAMVFTLITTVLNIILPFIVAYRSRGFWMRSASFYEQPKVYFTYDYLLVLETEDSRKPLVCGAWPSLDDTTMLSRKEYCADLQIQEYDTNRDGVNDFIDFKFHLIIPGSNTIMSLMLILGLNYQLTTVCPLHMQSLAVIGKLFPMPPSGFEYLGDINLKQFSHLPCAWNKVDTRYNVSLFDGFDDGMAESFVLDPVMEMYFKRDVKLETNPAHIKSKIGHTGTMDMKFSLRIPESQVLYTPSFIQEFIWAWPQYLALFIIFYWLFDKIKGFVFKNRLLMAWEVVPWKT